LVRGVEPDPHGNPQVALVVVVLDRVPFGFGDLDQVLVGVVGERGNQAGRVRARGVDVLLDLVVEQVVSGKISEPTWAHGTTGAGFHRDVGHAGRDAAAGVGRVAPAAEDERAVAGVG